MKKLDITLYVAGGQWGQCLEAKEFLGQKGLEFTELNILQNEKARQEMLMISGQHNPPVLKINDYVVPTFDRSRVEEALGNFIN